MVVTVDEGATVQTQRYFLSALTRGKRVNFINQEVFINIAASESISHPGEEEPGEEEVCVKESDIGGAVEQEVEKNYLFILNFLSLFPTTLFCFFSFFYELRPGEN